MNEWMSKKGDGGEIVIRIQKWMSEWVSESMNGGSLPTATPRWQACTLRSIVPFPCAHKAFSPYNCIQRREAAHKVWTQNPHLERGWRSLATAEPQAEAAAASTAISHREQGRYLRAFEPTQLVLVIQAPHKHFGSYCSCWLQPGSLLSNETRNKGRNKALKHEGAPLSKESISKICFSTWNHQSVYKQVLQRTSISTDMDDSCRLSLYLTFSTANIYRLVCFLSVHLLVFKMGSHYVAPSGMELTSWTRLFFKLTEICSPQLPGC